MNVEGGFQLGDILGIVRRRGKVAALLAMAVFLVAYWIAMALPNVYRSSAKVLVEPQAVDEDLVKAGVRDSDLNERLHLMTAQILSRARLSRVIDDLGLYSEESVYMLREEVIDLMRSRVSVAPVIPDLERAQARAAGGRPRERLEINQFQIFFSDYSPALARDVAQRLANDFIETHIDARIQVSTKSLEFIDGELERLATRIRAIEAKIAQVKNENPGKLPDDMQANQRRLERLLIDLATAQRALAEAESDEAFYKSQLAAAATFSAPNDPASPGRRLELLKLELGDLQSRGYTEKHPDVIKTRAEIEALEESLASDGSGHSRPGSLLQQQAGAEARRAGLRRNAAIEEIARLQTGADEVEDLIGRTPAVAEQLDALGREYEHLFTSFQDFSNRQQEATVQAQLERRQLGEQFRVLEKAFLANKPSSPNRILILMLGAMLGIAVGGAAGVLLETVDTSAHDARQLQSRLQLPVLAAIPQIWLESDRAQLRRKRLRESIAVAGLVVFALVGGAANYMWVNGAPRIVASVFSGETEQLEEVEAGGAAEG